MKQCEGSNDPALTLNRPFLGYRRNDLRGEPAAMIKIEPGYVAFNGYVFNAYDATVYNMACEKAYHFPTEANLDNRHRVFCIIIGMTP